MQKEIRSADENADYVFQMHNITKTFPGVKALDGVNFSVRRGTIHALVGENGAGKSTLIKTLSGFYGYGSYQGDIVVDERVQKFENTKDSEAVGISVIYQELGLVPLMSVVDNLFLGNEQHKRGIIRYKKALKMSKEALTKVRLQLKPEVTVGSLGVGQQQLVEIAKALIKQTRVLVLDEPTAALNEEDSINLLDILRELQKEGVTCIYISHKLEEILSIADELTILRDGHTIDTQVVKGNAQMTEAKLISLMVGRSLEQRFPYKKRQKGKALLEVKNWCVQNPKNPEVPLIDNASFKLHTNEILGIAGLMGSGRTELFESLFGVYGILAQGEVRLKGSKIDLSSPSTAIKAGVAYLSEDRKQKGLVLLMDIIQNSSLASLPSLSKYGVIHALEELKEAKKYAQMLQIKTPFLEQKVSKLSGGNQQKVALAKWLMTRPTVLFLDEPTRGIDVGAKFEIYQIINELVDMGVGVVVISSELPEVLGMSDRVMVLSNGKITGCLLKEEANQEKLMHLATMDYKGGKA